eukprot:3221423-Pleurochrysis_carterae.AAC.1
MNKTLPTRSEREKAYTLAQGACGGDLVSVHRGFFVGTQRLLVLKGKAQRVPTVQLLKSRLIQSDSATLSKPSMFIEVPMP